MLNLKSLKLLTLLFSFSFMLSACNSVIFPEIDENEEDIVVHEGGRVDKTDSKVEEDDTIKSDAENAAYEGQEDEEVDEEPELPADVSSEDIEIPEEDKVTPAKTTPVAVEDGISSAEQVAENQQAKSDALIDEMLGNSDEPSVNYRAETILFENGSAVVDSKYNAALSNLVKQAKAHNATLKVYGYASSRTRNTDIVSHKMANFKVSLQRAENVAAVLKRAGQPADKIVIEALSDSAPLYKEVMPEGERLNRRAEVYIVY